MRLPVALALAACALFVVYCAAMVWMEWRDR
jgi:hypothetical protein